MSTYYGCTNHATWLVNNLIVSDESVAEAVREYCAVFFGRLHAYHFQRYVAELFDLPTSGIAADLCKAMLCDVNWMEIYEHHKPEELEDDDYSSEGE